MRSTYFAFFLVFFFLVGDFRAFAQSATESQVIDESGDSDNLNPACSVQITIDGTIGPSSFDFLQRAIEKANERRCSSLIVLINTPGGSLQSTSMSCKRRYRRY